MPVTSEVALVVDALPGLGGAEKVLLAAMELFPQAPVYTLVYNREAFAHTPIASRQVIPSYINRLPLARTQYRKYLPLMPQAIERFDLSRHQQIISFSYAVAHGVITRPGQTHLSPGQHQLYERLAAYTSSHLVLMRMSLQPLHYHHV